MNYGAPHAKSYFENRDKQYQTAEKCRKNFMDPNAFTEPLNINPSKPQSQMGIWVLVV